MITDLYGVTPTDVSTAQNNVNIQAGWLANGLNSLGLNGNAVGDTYITNAYNQLNNGTSPLYASGLAGVQSLSQQGDNASVPLFSAGAVSGGPFNIASVGTDAIQKGMNPSKVGQNILNGANPFSWGSVTLTQAVTVILGLIFILIGLILFWPKSQDSGITANVVKLVSDNPEVLAA